MNLTRQRQLIYAATTGLVALSVAGVVWSLSSIDGPASDGATRIGPSRLRSTIAKSKPIDAAQKVNFDAPMLKPLVDPVRPPVKPPPRKVTPPPPKKTAPVPTQRLDWTLVGTIMDGDDSVAILSDAKGKTDVRRVGETVELLPAGAVVQRIQADQVSLKTRRGQSTLKLDRSFQSIGGRNSRFGRGANR